MWNASLDVLLCGCLGWSSSRHGGGGLVVSEFYDLMELFETDDGVLTAKLNIVENMER